MQSDEELDKLFREIILPVSFSLSDDEGDYICEHYDDCAYSIPTMSPKRNRLPMEDCECTCYEKQIFKLGLEAGKALDNEYEKRFLKLRETILAAASTNFNWRNGTWHDDLRDSLTDGPTYTNCEKHEAE